MFPLILLGLAGAAGGYALYRAHLSKGAMPTPGVFAPLAPGKSYRVLVQPGPQYMTAQSQVTAPPGAAVNPVSPAQNVAAIDLAQQGFQTMLVTPVTSQGGAGVYVLFGTFKGGQAAFVNTPSTTVTGVQLVTGV